MVRYCNAFLIVRIPKKKGAIERRDYRPASLIRSVYDIAAKVLAEKSIRFVNTLVSDQQSVFIKGRQIIDTSLRVKEVLDWKIRRGETSILLKLDIEKTFDQLNWSFLINMLKKMDRWPKKSSSASQQSNIKY